MKAISLWQPWATLIALGAKRVETRSWSPGYTGMLAIHAAKRVDRASLALCLTEPFRTVLVAGGITYIGNLPFGQVVAVCTLVKAARTQDVRDRLTEQERAFGDYGDGRWAWALAGIQRLARPLGFKGRQGWFDVPDHLIAEAAAPETLAEGVVESAESSLFPNQNARIV